MQPIYQITEKILNLVQAISELTTTLSLEQRQLHLRKENRLRSIQSSLAIEKNSLSLEQVTAIIDGKRVLGPLKDIHEVQNAYQAYERAFRLSPYLVEDFLEAHRLLTQDLVKRPGQFRIGDVGVFDTAGQVVHLGARPQFIPALVEELFSWARESQVSAIVKSCVVHFELEIIHPFEDGNGRIGRLWQSLILSHWNPIFEWLPIESVVYQHQQGYYDALSISNEQNDSTVFIEFMLEAILATLEEYRELGSKPTKEVESGLTSKEMEMFSRILLYVQEHGRIDTATLRDLSGLSVATCRRYLSLFVEKGLLEPHGTTRSRYYTIAN